MSYEIIAFYTGTLASLHCVAMCGPLILSLPFSTQSIWFSIYQKVLYQAGRISVYGIMGIFTGFLGSGFNLLKLQQTLSLVTGILLIMAGINYFVKKRTTSNKLITVAIQSLTRLLGKYWGKPYGSFLAGSINGLLPCGMVYIALAGAINLHTPYESGRFMVFFGLGTSPLLFLTAALPIFFRRFKTPVFLTPALFLIAGGFLIMRGLNVNIPHRHTVKSNTTEVCR